MDTCANPGCDQPGTNKCSGCKTTPYCGPICQKDHWPIHKESCDGRLRKMGMDHLNKAKGFQREQNWSQLLRYSNLAATKLKQLKDRPIDDISDALCYKCNALSFLGQHREQLECAKEWYCLWNTKPTDMGAINAAFALIDSCMANKEYADARLYASTLREIINHKYDNKIPEDQRQEYIARGVYFHSEATLRLAKDGDIPPEEKQKAGQEVIALARRALEIHSQLHGTESVEVACDVCLLAEALDYFNDDDDDDEVLRLFEQAIIIYVRLQSNMPVNVALCESKLADTYVGRAKGACVANDLEREQENLELALSRYRETARIYNAVNHRGAILASQIKVVEIEVKLRQLTIARAAATTK